MKAYGYIYKITNKINGKVYIGQTTNNFDRRYRSGNVEKYTHNEHLKNSIKKYGIENFSIEKEFDIAYDKKELDDKEDFYVNKYNCLNPSFGYNKKEAGSNGKPTEETRRKQSEVHKGVKLSEETKRKMSEAKKGEKSHMFGIAKPLETRLKISKTLTGRKLPREVVEKSRLARIGMKATEEAKNNMSVGMKKYYKYNEHHCKGKIFSDEHRKNISLGRKGIVFSEEHKQKLSEAKKGKSLSDEHKKKISESGKGRTQTKSSIEKRSKALSFPVRCVTTNKEFGNAKEGAKYYNMKSSSVINLCCNGKQRTAGKLEDGTRLVWEYIKNTHDNTEVNN